MEQILEQFENMFVEKEREFDVFPINYISHDSQERIYFDENIDRYKVNDDFIELIRMLSI